jgi:hypothetical protein
LDPDQSDRTENASKLLSSPSAHRLEATEEAAEEAADEAVEVFKYCRLVVEQREAEDPPLEIFF